ncbi:MAG: response regulator [Chloroflexi bacterium]|nr:response regulator [Chloroflexota bacterium]
MPLFRVLIVEDHREMARVIRSALELQLGQMLDVVDVPSAEEAILEVAAWPPDVMIVDLGLPGLSGAELIWRVKEALPHIKFIVVTAWDESRAQRAIKNLPIQALFHKPPPIPDIVAAVEEALGLSKHQEDEETADIEAIFGDTGKLERADELWDQLVAEAEAQEPEGEAPSTEAQPETPTTPETSEPALAEHSPEREATPFKRLSYNEAQARIGELLQNLSDELQTEAVLLLAEHGQVVYSVGYQYNSPIIEQRAQLLMLHTQGMGLARGLGMTTPQYFCLFESPKQEYCIASVADYYLLVVIQQKKPDRPALVDHIHRLQTTVEEIRAILKRLGVLEEMDKLTAPLVGEDEGEAEALMDEAEADELALPEASSIPALEDADAFWAQVDAEAPDVDMVNPEALSFEEARRLGLLPQTDLLELDNEDE